MNKDLYKGVPFTTSILDFDKFVVNSEKNKEQLITMIKKCEVDNHKIRCDVWRLCLGIFEIDSSYQQKAQQLQKQRQRYHELVEKHTKKEQEVQKVISQNPKLANNPLGRLLVPKPVVAQPKQETDDKFLQDEVRKDVQRTYQQKQFFTNLDIIKILSNVLFIWSKEHPDISYQQGMNQVSASIIWVYFTATVDPNQKYKQYEGIVEQLIQKYLFFHSNQHAQADIYSMFDKMMNSGHKLMFKAQNQNNKQINPNSKNNSHILQRIIKLSDIKFKMVDEKLFKHFKLNDVGMRSFLLRWIRCIHTREFELEESFVIWDNIFLAYLLEPDHGLCFVDCTTLAMLMYLRDIALKKDTGFEILQLYQKYPKIQGKYLKQLMELSWDIKHNLDVANQKQSEKKKEIHEIRNISYKQPQSSSPTKAQSIKKIPSAPAQKPIQKPIQKTKKLSTQIKKPIVQIKKPEPQSKKIVFQSNKPTQVKKSQSTQTKAIKPPKQYEFDMLLSFKQWKQIQTLMKKSIEQNTDIQSRSLAMKALKIISQKQQQEIKKIEASNSLLEQ